MSLIDRFLKLNLIILVWVNN